MSCSIKYKSCQSAVDKLLNFDIYLITYELEVLNVLEEELKQLYEELNNSMSLNILLRVQDLSSFTLNVYTDYVAYYNNLMNLFITVSVTGEGSLMVYSTILTKQSFKTLSLQKHDLTSFEFEVSKF